jgi:hypothetical protein
MITRRDQSKTKTSSEDGTTVNDAALPVSLPYIQYTHLTEMSFNIIEQNKGPVGPRREGSILCENAVQGLVPAWRLGSDTLHKNRYERKEE